MSGLIISLKIDYEEDSGRRAIHPIKLRSDPHQTRITGLSGNAGGSRGWVADCIFINTKQTRKA